MVTPLSKKLTKRRHIREKAVQAVFQLIDRPDQITVDQAITFALEAGNDPESGFDEIGNPYLTELVYGVQENREAIDKEIEPFLSDWTLDRIAKIDLAILRVAIYEILFVDNEIVPPKTAVNEAIDLAKWFSDDKSRIFVSGVLLEYLNQLAK